MAKDKKKKDKHANSIQITIPTEIFSDADLETFLLDPFDLPNDYGIQLALPDDIPGDHTLGEYLN